MHWQHMHWQHMHWQHMHWQHMHWQHMHWHHMRWLHMHWHHMHWQHSMRLATPPFTFSALDHSAAAPSSSPAAAAFMYLHVYMSRDLARGRVWRLPLHR